MQSAMSEVYKQQAPKKPAVDARTSHCRNIKLLLRDLPSTSSFTIKTTTIQIIVTRALNRSISVGNGDFECASRSNAASKTIVTRVVCKDGSMTW